MFVENENDALNENIVKVTHSGMQTLNGLQATAYCRIRYVGDDFGRAERQRKVLMACMDKAKTMSPTTLVSILNKVMENVYTNLDVTEMASILSCKDDGVVYFFSMATSFTKAALGAEGVGKDVNMIIGNGYTKGHSEVALQVLREDERIRNLFAQLYA